MILIVLRRGFEPLNLSDNIESVGTLTTCITQHIVTPTRFELVSLP